MKSFISLSTFSFLAIAVPIFAQTSSPFPPPEEKLGTYVINSGQGLDTGCTFRSDGPLIVQIEVPAVVNPQEINPDGTLKNPSKLISANIIGTQATVRFPVYDIDSGANIPRISPEVDRLSFNGKFIKTLQGFNNTWTDDSLVVPIDVVKFRSVNSPNATNELRVDIDTANSTEEWCMAIDWVAIEFDVAVPYVLAHGIASSSDAWDEIVTTLDGAGVLYDRFSVTSNGRSAGNAAQLQGLIKGFLDPIKSKKVHIIAHSKGGLDTQELQAMGPPFKILSLSTLSTPHLGSVAADLSIIQKTDADDKINTGQDPNGFALAYLGTGTFGFGPQLPGLYDLATGHATAAIAAGLRGNIQPTFTFGANANRNGNNDLETDESAGMPAASIGYVHHGYQRAWRVMRDFSSAPIVSITQVPGRRWGTRTVLTYKTALASSPQNNDIVVTILSANPSYGTPLGNSINNHSTIVNAANIRTILLKTIPMR